MFVFFFVSFNGLLFWMFLVILCFETGSNISSDPFFKLALLMSCIVISCRIMSPSMDCRHDNVTYMLYIFKCTLLGVHRRSMFKLSNVCPCALKFVRQKANASGNWYLLIMHVLDVFNSNMWWWYWKFLDMNLIGMTFLKRPSSFMFCNFMFFSMKSLKID